MLIYGASKLKLSENASAILPQSGQTEELNTILENININDRIFFNVFLADTSAINQDLLIQYSRQLNDSLSLLMGDYITEIQLNVQSGSVQETGRYVIRNLPFLLTDDDYRYFDTLLYEGRLESSFKKRYKSLMSPASIMLKELVVSDPAGLSSRALSSLRSFQLDKEINLDRGYLFTQDKKHLLFFITPKASSSETAANANLVEIIDNQIKNISGDFQGQVKAEFFGAPVVAAGNAVQIKRDIILTVSMALLLNILLIAFFYKSRRLYFILFIPAILAVLSSMAILYLLKGEVSAIALGLGSVLVGISIDYVIHIFTHFRQTRNMEKVLNDVSTPILMSAVTTAVSFLGLLIVSAPALKDMGLFAGISIMFSAFFSLIFIPVLLRRNPSKNEKVVRKPDGFQRLIQQLVTYPFYQKKYLLLFILFISPVFFYLSKQVNFQTDMNSINYMDAKTKTAEEHLNQISKLSQRNVYMVSLGGNLQEALELNESLEQQLSSNQIEPLILAHTSIAHILPSRALQTKNAEKWNRYWTEEKRGLLLSKLNGLQKEYGFKSGSFNVFEQWFGSNFSHISDEDEAFIQDLFLKEFVQRAGDKYMAITQIKTSAQNKSGLYEALSGTTSPNLQIIDKEFLTRQFVDILKVDFQKLVNLTFLVVFLIIWMSFGRIELAVITYLPLALSWIWTLGLMHLLQLEFNIVNIIISTFIFGLGIDYSIFIAKGLIQEYKTGEQNSDSYKTGILFSALTTIFGIGVLIFAEHPALKSMALITVIGLSSVLLLSFTLQPLLFRWLIYIKQDKRRLVPITAQNLLGSVVALLVFSVGSLLNTVAGFFLITLTGGKLPLMRLWFHKLIQATTWFMVYIMFNVRKNVTGWEKHKFHKPAIIISNHQSHIDIMLMLMLHPKMILLTNEWVQRNFFYGKIVKMAEFYPILDHLHEHMDLLKRKIADGYSVMVFPEGTRSENGRIGRFHKGAFYLAEQLELDILPIILHGSGDCITKGEPFLKSGRIDVVIGDRVAPQDKMFGEGYVERSKAFRRWYQTRYDDLRAQIVGPDYFRKWVDMQYIYKGPVLEWYVKIKMNFENNYHLFNELIPKKAHIADLGCGNGMMGYMLVLLSKDRTLIGVDYDGEKIQTANNISLKDQLLPGQIKFESDDLTNYNYPEADIYILADVLHYMPENEQLEVLRKAVEKLSAGGKIIIRDADIDLQEKHRGTAISEWQSTKLFKFNKTKDSSKTLYFTSAATREAWLQSLGLQVKLIDQTKMNSNVVLVGEKRLTV